MHKESKKRTRLLIGLMLAVMAICIVITVWAVFFREPANSPDTDTTVSESQTSEESEPVEKLEDSIAIPGYSQLNLTAGVREQDIALSNPEQNTCYFKISLIMEDGTVIWTSDLVKPGAQSDPITLEEPLEAGTYDNVTVHYDCYTMDGSMTQLNSGETIVKLVVS